MLQLLTARSNTSHSPARHPVRALVLVPTRELAAQVQESVRTYGKHLQLRSTVIYGGVGINPQIAELRRGVDIVVATPGRLLDHVQQKTIDLRQVEILVLDEADRMLDMGFIHDIRRILALLPAKRQNLLFSATFSEDIRKLSGQFLNDPATVEVARRYEPIELIAQIAHPVDKDRKRALLSHLVKTNSWQQVLVFTKTKHGANRLAEQLAQDGIDADAIHGNKSQPARTRALKRFKDNELQVLVATDIAARGLDIEALPHVVNYDLPHVSEDYVHRIGRTGRAGSTGEAVSLVSGEDRPLMAAIERLINRKVEHKTIEGFEPGSTYHTAKHEPEQRRGGQRRGEPRKDGQRRGEPRKDGQRRGEPRKDGQRRGEPRLGEPRRPDGQSRAPQANAQSRRPRPAQANAQPGRGRQGNAKPQRRPEFRAETRRPDEDERVAQAQHHSKVQREEQPARTKQGPVATLLGMFGRKAA